MRRRPGPTLLALALAGVCVLGTLAAVPARDTGSPSALPPDLDPKVGPVLSPLFGMPAIRAGDDCLRVELDPEAVGSGEVSATLVPSFGEVRTPVDLGSGATRVGPSSLWPGRDVAAVTFALDGVAADFYDLTVAWDGGSDTQRRAVRVVPSYPEEPRVVVIADPSVGDPRPVQDGQDSAMEGDPGPLVDKTVKTAGVTDGNGRWGALQRVVDEINIVRPDFVLVAGDLTFAFHPRAYPYEYEDAWEILDRVEVPTFLSPGNHDLYSFDDYATGGGSGPGVMDGQAMWQAYFGPLYYSTDAGPGLHIVSLNTFDWQEQMPFPPPEFDTLSGGQIRAEQLAWLEADLASYRAANDDGEIVTIAHHDPSWPSGRHPWPGENRIELRELFRRYDVGAHFAGHTHEDRVARYHEGSIVQTNGRPHMDHPVGELSYLLPDNDIDTSWGQDDLAAILHEPLHGPLFVTTTTAASGLEGEDWGLGGYWGWRLANLVPEDGGGYDPAHFGYPASRAFLDEHAERPGNWNADHARHGLFSYPSYHLEQETEAGNTPDAAETVVTVRSALDVGVDGVVRLVVGGPAEGLVVRGGDLVRARTDGETTDVWVRVAVPADGDVTVRVSR